MKAWATTELADVCTLITDGTHHSPLNLPVGDYKYVTAKNIRPWGLDLSNITYVDEATHQGIYARCPVEYGDVLYIKDGVTTGIAALNTLREPFSMLSSVALLKPEHTVLEPRYLKHWLNSPDAYQAMTGEMTGTAIKRLVLKQIRATSIAIAPRSEQKRIADKLDTVLARVDACRDRLDRLPALLKRFRQSILAAATSGRLTEDWRSHHNCATNAQTNELPTGWNWSCPDSIKSDERYALAIGPFGSNLKVADYTNAGIPLVFVREIRARSFGSAQTKFVTTSKAAELFAHSIAGGDLLITKMGDPPGDTAIYPADAPMAVITADCIKLRVNCSVADTKFVQIVLESPQSRTRLQEITAGVAQQKISLERFRTFPLPLAPLDEQTEIVRRVETLFAFADRLESRLASARRQVGQLTPALLAKAFRGELVAQDPADEPASELLKRLATQRAAAPVAKRGRKNARTSADA